MAGAPQLGPRRRRVNDGAAGERIERMLAELRVLLWACWRRRLTRRVELDVRDGLPTPRPRALHSEDVAEIVLDAAGSGPLR